uniref:Uncharacterized protein n=1 Tax=Timema cristinae TaxID=61476 RepID=A0A7R9GS51_TIMCR|nr:unnamed protein product [Timema cristinae]
MWMDIYGSSHIEAFQAVATQYGRTLFCDLIFSIMGTTLGQRIMPLTPLQSHVQTLTMLTEIQSIVDLTPYTVAATNMLTFFSYGSGHTCVRVAACRDNTGHLCGFACVILVRSSRLLRPLTPFQSEAPQLTLRLVIEVCDCSHTWSAETCRLPFLEIYLHLCDRSMKNHFGKIIFSTPDRDSNLELPIIGCLVYCKSSALEHVAIKSRGFSFHLRALSQPLDLLLDCAQPQLQLWGRGHLTETLEKLFDKIVVLDSMGKDKTTTGSADVRRESRYLRVAQSLGTAPSTLTGSPTTTGATLLPRREPTLLEVMSLRRSTGSTT